MSEQSMNAYFRQELEAGNTPSDPFEEASTAANKKLTEEEKAIKLKEWNLQIMKNHAARIKNQKKMLGRRAARTHLRRR